ncbi:hypothetical protein K438DRAFT_1769078 [Mycena galopus ATCC 62051]|nr:hypothetical protein K438DRAFT_1769078 [Mycena galopus ATCC 62051]
MDAETECPKVCTNQLCPSVRVGNTKNLSEKMGPSCAVPNASGTGAVAARGGVELEVRINAVEGKYKTKKKELAVCVEGGEWKVQLDIGDAVNASGRSRRVRIASQGPHHARSTKRNAPGYLSESKSAEMHSKQRNIIQECNTLRSTNARFLGVLENRADPNIQGDISLDATLTKIKLGGGPYAVLQATSFWGRSDVVKLLEDGADPNIQGDLIFLISIRTQG